jgi:hypothetical protein
MSLMAELEELVEEGGPKLADYKNLIGVRGIGPVGVTAPLSVINRTSPILVWSRGCRTRTKPNDPDASPSGEASCRPRHWCNVSLATTQN